MILIILIIIKTIKFIIKIILIIIKTIKFIIKIIIFIIQIIIFLILIIIKIIIFISQNNNTFNINNIKIKNTYNTNKHSIDVGDGVIDVDYRAPVGVITLMLISR
jgi:hypothetical protein